MLLQLSRAEDEADAAAVDDLRQRFQTAENALSAKIAQQIKRENAIADRFDTQTRRFVSSFLDTVPEKQRVDARVKILIRLAQQNDIDFWADADRTRQIVRFQDSASQVRDFLDFCTSTLAMVYNAMFPRNPQPANLSELMNKFKNVHQIHQFVKAQLMAGARFAFIWLKICYLKLDLNIVIDICHSKLKQRRKNVDKLNDAVTPIAEKMIEELLRVDAAFFQEYHYADALDAPFEGGKIADIVRDYAIGDAKSKTMPLIKLTTDAAFAKVTEYARWYWQTLQTDVCQIVGFINAEPTDVIKFVAIKEFFDFILYLLVCYHAIIDCVALVHHLLNPSKEIFSELDETFAQGPIFARSFQKTEEITKWGHEAAGGQGGTARPWPRRPTSGPLVPPALTLRLLKASVAKPQYREPRYGKPCETPPRIPSRGIQEIASGTLPERGFISRRTLHRHGRLRSDE
ncbi:hypothetical protein QYE76_028326 [Lolium multiflorum]|uniref:Uncharacterized protein n=1 Tax=Lolium multiflorum TaxID=4521 RepID=A0AAD8VH23_LOLMU|nr:hypothetical protein QYE76_028326 [Lolium multiflorum]